MKPLPNGLELPIIVVAVQFAENDRRFRAVVLAQIVAGELLSIGIIDHANVCVADHAEVLPANVGLVDCYGKRDLLNLGWDLGDIDLDLLIVSVAAAGLVVSHTLHRATRALRLIVEDKVHVAAGLACCSEQKCRRVKVEIGAIRRAWVPPEPKSDLAEAATRLLA